MRVRWGVASVLLATLFQVLALTADASPDLMKLSGRAINVVDGQAIAAMRIELFDAAPGQQGPPPKPIAETVTESNGMFHVTVSRAAPLAMVKIRVFPPLPLPCGGVALIHVAGAAQAYVAHDELPTIAPRTFQPSGAPTPSAPVAHLNVNGVAATFEAAGQIGTDKDCIGSLALYRTRDRE